MGVYLTRQNRHLTMVRRNAQMRETISREPQGEQRGSAWRRVMRRKVSRTVRYKKPSSVSSKK